MKFKAGVKVTLKEGVLDPQGVTIGRALSDLGFESVIGVSTGKLFELEIDAESEAKAREIATEATSKLLANPVIEGYEIEVIR
ncbi:MAG: phosphoribosylformylglycinamidine synthase subunit PurS [candidate division Zixibacteria bacterium]